MVPEIKICGIQTAEDVQILSRYPIQYAGFVLFYPKSKRNLSESEASHLLGKLDKRIRSVAVVVSPDADRIKRLEQMGFDYIQIHGTISCEILQTDIVRKYQIPIWRAYHIDQSACSDMDVEDGNRIEGYVLDGKRPGAGEPFDWTQMTSFSRRGKKLILAGGLTAENVRTGIDLLKPDIVDVSSAVERTDGCGKDEKKIKDFVGAVIR